MKIIYSNTPIEVYDITGRIIGVKRDDMATRYPSPKLAKLRGVLPRMYELNKDYKKIGVFDTRISKAGWGVAYLAREAKLKAKIYSFYPKLKDSGEKLETQQSMTQKLGATLIPMKGGRTGILYARAKRTMEECGGYMLPLGLVLEESVKAITVESKTVPKKFLGGTICLSVGSGMTIAGIDFGIGSRVDKIIGISAGMDTKKQRNRVLKITGKGLSKKVELIKPEGVEYYDRETIETPFPSSDYYDKKAWRWLLKNYTLLKKPVLFWNIGE